MDVSVLRARRENLFDAAGVEHRCENDHKRRASEAYCSACGARVKERRVDTPKPALVAYAEKRGEAPASVWESAMASGVHCVDAVQWPEKDGEAFAFGEIVDDVDGDDCSGPAFDAVGNLAAAESRILAAAKELEIPKPHVVEVFACACLSS